MRAIGLVAAARQVSQVQASATDSEDGYLTLSLRCARQVQGSVQGTSEQSMEVVAALSPRLKIGVWQEVCPGCQH